MSNSRDEDPLGRRRLPRRLDPVYLQMVETPTFAERLLFGLGHVNVRQLSARRNGVAGAGPHGPFDVITVAEMIGVAEYVEYVQQDPWGVSYLFPGEVLAESAEDPFPWRIRSLTDWAEDQQIHEDIWRSGRA